MLCMLTFGLYERTEWKHDGECISELSQKEKGGIHDDRRRCVNDQYIDLCVQKWECL